MAVGFNRTFMELKSKYLSSIEPLSYSFNRTFMELKSDAQRASAAAS